jgi:hypothetical protein
MLVSLLILFGISWLSGLIIVLSLDAVAVDGYEDASGFIPTAPQNPKSWTLASPGTAALPHLQPPRSC